MMTEILGIQLTADQINEIVHLAHRSKKLDAIKLVITAGATIPEAREIVETLAAKNPRRTPAQIAIDLERENAALRERVAALEAENAQLEAKLQAAHLANNLRAQRILALTRQLKAQDAGHD